ncbi:gamma-mobile-trio recombinase GmtY [Pseudomonas syringae]|uniref:Integrase n=1 Tax=Pseudomonas syringae pv. actinidiae TaxID=103796 RepID=A0A2V0QGJ7_PSESF|nr:gamma-mobile-trio recombinase GmtY [Pseudomonas syringae]AQL37121.1 integrase [Pseudomonas syringae pv. actinidiae ICMP 9853]EGH65863.1 integrase family protein [Pseudomonas syringae pv. actinidiae str. M302091]EPM52141.1 integrase family protein [Pseudomonas syringae pv. actinidiae ICMP 19103]EPM87062.1 integrase family protein [Pseudomonas syringae pv. actinidiae ICMP 19068]EPM95931.1 integrase family protein [Pseudomonas syringae pv. actinidiae ICMP 19104]EPN03520.1 integrase family pro
MFVTVKARVYTDATGVYTELPALLTPTGVLESLLDYYLYRSHDRSLAWMAKVARSVGMFLEYLQTNPAERDTYQLFQNFAQRLYTGTFDRETGLDPSGLCWARRSPQDASHIMTHLTDFFDWLSEMYREAPKLNPQYAGGAFDRQAVEAAYQYRRSKAFLGHSWAANASPTETGHRVRSRRLPKVERGEPPAFPEERFEELLMKGFRSAGRFDYRGMLITLLLHGAGFRESETFHLYVPDVFPDPASSRRAKVLIHHPSYGAAPADWHYERGRPHKGNRAEYLAQKFGIVPRTDLMDRRHAGWKGGTHDGPYYKQAYWFLPEYGEWFLKFWHRYLEQVVHIERDHPFAFINLSREPVGAMYTLTQYNKAHAAACERIGLSVGKALGTTPHGHRHAYGRRLSNAGIDKALIRRFMHHASLESQDVYTQANTREVLAALETAAQLLRAKHTGTFSSSDLLLPDIELND